MKKYTFKFDMVAEILRELMILVYFCYVGRINVDHKKTGCEITDWIQLAKDRYQQ